MSFARMLLHPTTRRMVLKGVIAAGTVSTALRSHISFAQDATETPEADPTPARFTSPQTLIVGGLDARGEGQPENSDVLMLCRIDLENKTLRVLNLNRDLYLEIPGFGADKITRAFDFGQAAQNGSFKAGSELLKATIEHNFGVTADSTVMTTFGGFEAIINAFNGVTVVNPYDVSDTQYPTEDYGVKSIDYPAGEQELSGEQALEFCRTRHQDGDPGRVMRQQIVLRALLDEANTNLDADGLWDLVKANRKKVLTDLGPSKQLAYTLAVPDFSNDNIEFGNLLDYMYADTAPNGAWIYSGMWDQIPAFVEGFLDGSIDVPQDIVAS